ncbi:MAG: DinB family protein [Candidatus Zixiibacteriota bacterium]|nr:MAG: DinB family protein [candidate division Zixibacteria bacterium]
MTKSAILKYWENVRKLTLTVFDLFPQDKFDFRPVADVRSVAEQFDHILICELYARIGLLTGVWDISAFSGERDLSRNRLRDKLYSENKKTLGLFRMLPEGQFMKVYETPFGAISGEALIYETIDEEIHHRGNLYVYLRLLGIAPPQMVQNYADLFMED